MTRRHQAELGFDALRLEGALFSAEHLARLAHGQDEKTQREVDYQIPRGLKLRDELGRAFRIGQALWLEFSRDRQRSDRAPGAASEQFVTTLLRDALGFHDLHPVAPVEMGLRVYPIGYAARGRVPVVIASHGLGLDQADGGFAEGRRLSAFQFTQEYLNAAPDGLWGLVSNGLRLRLLRDSASLTRPAYLEADLERLFEEARYAEFSALWLLIHASRFGAPEQPAGECILERWREASREEGSRVRERLREGVTAALRVLGEGFLRHGANTALRARLATGELSADGYFQQLLRLVYRLIFLFTVEDREILHPPGADPAAVALYREGYGVGRLRERALRRAGYDRHHDLWQGLTVVFTALGRGEPLLGLPALGGLFDATQCADLDGAELGNRALLAALRQLAWFRQGAALSRVNYRDMGSEELGSVYESLLELVPRLELAGRRFGFQGLDDGGSTRGNARKLSGSYYTPDSLVTELLNSALDPVVARTVAENPTDPVGALLRLAVLDPACGSGHFLLGAGRRLAERVAMLRSVDGNPGPEDYRHALREVVSRCLFGVDRNPMAVELARMALWLEAYTPDAPLSFLDHHLLCGDALLGLLDFEALREGIPDGAFKVLSGDDAAVCREFSKANRQGRKQLERQFGRQATLDLGDWAIADTLAALDRAADDSLPAVVAKREAFVAAQAEAAQHPLARAADLYVAAFLAAKTPGAVVPTSEDVLRVLAQLPVDGAVEAVARRVCTEARVLHWRFVYAQVFERGGFDVVLGNPPWERIKLQEEEFFASRDAEVAGARNKAERGRAIQALADSPAGSGARELYEAFLVARRLAEAVSVFVHTPARFPLTGVGDVNTYALFAETFARVVASGGRAGLIVPTGISTDDGTKRFFGSLVAEGRLASLLSFENEEFVFPSVHHAYRFCLLTLSGARYEDEATFVFFARQTPQVHDANRRFHLSAGDIARVNPNTLTCPTFRSRADADLTRSIYQRVPVLWRDARVNPAGVEVEAESNPWGLRFQRMMDMANDSGLFHDTPVLDRLPLYEAKLIHQFDHRWATYDAGDSRDATPGEKANPNFTVTPRYWVDEREVLSRIARVPRVLAAAWLGGKGEAIVAELGYWVAGHLLNVEGMRGFQNAFQSLNPWLAGQAPDGKRRLGAGEVVKGFPLDDDELAAVGKVDGEAAALALVEAWIKGRSPGWLMGWRDICRSTDERTVIASVVPGVGVNHKTPLFVFPRDLDPRLCAAFLGNLNALVLDYAARQKVGGTSLALFILKQLPMLSRDRYAEADLAFILPRILELTYTAHDLSPWARDLGHTGPPFPWHPERRAVLRAELDAYYARLYGLDRDELRYVLDPVDVKGADYPSETFRVLREREKREFGEYRTRRLVLEAWDGLEP